MDTNWDALVIGSGIGGLAAASALARVQGKRVLVLEKHLERGGLTHVFRRDGASWDVGLHYVGGVAPGDVARDLFDFFSQGRLNWNRMPHGFERFLYPGLNFVVPAEPTEYVEALVRRFPLEERGIRGYFRDLRKANSWALLGMVEQLLPGPAAAVVRGWRRLTSGVPTATTQAVLERRLRSPELRALLASQWPDYGLPPSSSAFALHALVVSSYLTGGWFPVGGASRVARTIETGIEDAGGGVLVGHEVTEILVEDGRAVGVRVVDRRGSVPVEHVLRAPVVISCVGAETTYSRLLPDSTDAATADTRAALAGLGRGPSAVALSLRLSAPVSALGVQGENFWINADFDHNNPAAHGAAVLAGAPTRAFLSFPSAKSGDERFHTAQLMTMVPGDLFATWAGSRRGARDADYLALKERIADGLVALAETVLPGFGALIDYRELSTPLTFEDYTSHPQGRFYGATGVPARFKPGFLGVRTPVPGLLLGGTDAGSLGIVGAMMGGVMAASTVLGRNGYGRLLKHVRQSSGAVSVPDGVPNALVGRHRVVLTSRTPLSPTVWRLDFDLESDLGFVPGQYVRLRVAPLEWRDYSVVTAAAGRLTLLVGTRTGGDGSLFAEHAPLGTVTAVEGPYGTFRLEPGARRRVFVATGTGLAPLLPIFAQSTTDELDAASLLFGCADEANDLTLGFDTLPGRTVVCLSRGEARPGAMRGRVTAALAEESFDQDTDFYVCGSAAMVRDVSQLLRARGVTRVFTESF